MRRALVAVLTGSLLAVGAPAAWLVLDDPGAQEYGGEVASALATASPADPPAGRADIGTRSALLSDIDVPAPPDLPAEVRVGDAVAPVDAVGLDSERLVVVPDDVRRAGWYSPGPAPGAAAGSAVLVGHVDDREQGLGTFAVLRELAPGAEVVIRTASGEDLAYEVVALEQFDKTEVPLARLFAPDGPHRLVLISCGGDFDSAAGSYSDNVVVTAVPRL